MSFLGIEGRAFLVLGLANRRSIAAALGKALLAAGARVAFTVHREARVADARKLFPDCPAFVCDVENEDHLRALPEAVRGWCGTLHGFAHSIAFANYAGGLKPFHETRRADFLQAVQISAFSLAEVAGALKPVLDPRAAVVTLGISSLLVTPDNYGYMGPAKAALESVARNLAKSFSADTAVRFNVVGAGPLRTASSSGIPGYLESYLYAEKMTFRKRALDTAEVANAALFLLSPASSGINGTTLVVDAGLGLNYFDREVVRLAMRPEGPPS